MEEVPQTSAEAEQWQNEISRLQEQVASLTRTIESLQKARNEGISSSPRAEVTGAILIGTAPQENLQYTFQAPNVSQHGPLSQAQIPISHGVQQAGQTPQGNPQQGPTSQPQIPLFHDFQQQQNYQFQPYSQEQAPYSQGPDFFTFGNPGQQEAIFTTGEPRVFPISNSQPLSSQPMFMGFQNIPVDSPESKEVGKKKEENEKLFALEERLRAIEGSKAYGPLNPEELCLVPGVVVPKKFKVPDFEKYTGATNPKTHLISYCREMTEVAHDDKLLIHFFHKSLTGAALKWYMQLDRSHVKSWKDLADAFIGQYRYNLDVAPNRTDLQNMEKKATESFKEYAQRWRELAAQVEPPLSDKEMAMTFIDTMKSPYYEYLIGNSSNNFADLVTTGERVEQGLKKGKISEVSTDNMSQKRTNTTTKKKEGEIHNVSSDRGRPRKYRNNNPQYGFQNQDWNNTLTQIPQSQYPQQQVANVTAMQPFPQTSFQNQQFPQQFPQYSAAHGQPIVRNFPQQQNTYQPRPQNTQTTRNNIPEEPLPPLPVPLSEIYKQLLSAHQIAPIPVIPLTPPYPNWYDANAHCEYHAGVAGHATDNCYALKKKVHQLIKHGWIKFGKMEKQPSVSTNPLPNHEAGGNGSVNMLETEDAAEEAIVGNVNWSMAKIFQMLYENGYANTIPLEHEVETQGAAEKICIYHQGTGGHDVETCEEFRGEVKRLLVLGVLRVERKIEIQKRVEEINMLGGDDNPTRKPLMIWYEAQSEVSATSSVFIPQPIIIQNPTTFLYKSDKAVPWNYNAKVVTNSPPTPQTSYLPSQTINQTPQPTINLASAIQGEVSYLSPQPLQQIDGMYELNEESVDAITTGGMTRSGRIYLSEEVENKRKGKGKEVEEQGVIVEPEGEPVLEGAGKNKPVSDEEASEFLKLMKQSEYCIVDQLKKTPAKISLLSLILTSEPHRQALQKVLNESYVMPDLEAEKFGHLVNQIQATNYITFTDDEIDPAGTGHVKALHISLKCRGYTVAKVLIDNGSSLNVLPLMTMKQLPIDQSMIRPSRMLVKAFDGTKSEVVGDIDLDLEIGPHVFTVTFQIMNIIPSYSMLLGRPWIHSSGAIPSSLHQKVKYIIDGKLVTICGEESLLVTKGPLVPYIEASEEAIESSFQAFEIAMASYVPESTPIPCPSLSQASRMMAKQMLKNNYKVGKGLGVSLQGIEEPVQLEDKQDKFGLGYRPNWKDYNRVREEKREKRLARLQNRESKYVKMEIPHIRVTFPQSVGVIDSIDQSVPLLHPNYVIMPDLSEIMSELSVNSLEVDSEDGLNELPVMQFIEQAPRVQEVKMVRLEINGVMQRIQVGTVQPKDIRNQVLELIRQFVDVFARELEEGKRDEATKSVNMVRIVGSKEVEDKTQPWVLLAPNDAPLTNWKEELLPVVFNSM